MAPRARVPRDHDLGLGRVGEDAAGGLARALAPQRRLGLVLDLLLDLGEERAVVLEGALAAPLPDLERGRPFLDLRREDEADLRLVDVPLAELGVREVPVPDELVGERAAHALEEETPDGVLEHAAV